MNIILYVVEDESKNCCESVIYEYTLQEAAEDALRYYQQMSKFDQKETEIWIYQYSVEKRFMGKDAEETYFNIVDYDFEELGYLRDPIDDYKLNRIHSKIYNSNVTLYDDFGNSFDFMISRDELPDDECDAVDYLYDEISDHLIADAETVRESKWLCDVEGIIESKFD